MTSVTYKVFSHRTSPNFSLQPSLSLSLARLTISTLTVHTSQGIFSGGNGHLVLFLWKNSREICPDLRPEDFFSSSAKADTSLLRRESSPGEEVLREQFLFK